MTIRCDKLTEKILIQTNNNECFVADITEQIAFVYHDYLSQGVRVRGNFQLLLQSSISQLLFLSHLHISELFSKLQRNLTSYQEAVLSKTLAEIKKQKASGIQ